MNKHVIKKKDILILLIFLIAVSSYFFKSQVGSLLYSIKYKNKNPVEWSGISIKYPEGLAYKKDKEDIYFFSWKHSDEYLYIRKMKLANIKKDNMLSFLKNKKIQIIENKETYFKGFDSIAISYLDNDTGTYNEWIYVVSLNVSIRYKGKKDKSNEFVQLIENIEFIDHDELND